MGNKIKIYGGSTTLTGREKLFRTIRFERNAKVGKKEEVLGNSSQRGTGRGERWEVELLRGITVAPKITKLCHAHRVCLSSALSSIS